MINSSNTYGSKRTISQAQHEATKSTEISPSFLQIYSPSNISVSNSSSLDSQQIINRSRRVLLNNLTTRHFDKKNELCYLSARKNPHQVHIYQKSSEMNNVVEKLKKKPEYFITEEDKDQEDREDYVLEYTTAYKQIDNGLDEASTLAAKSEIDLNRVKEGSAIKLNTVFACEEEYNEDEKAKSKVSLRQIMREVLERRQRLSTYESKLTKGLKLQGASLLQKPPLRRAKKNSLALVTDRRHRVRRQNPKEIMERTLISSISKLLKPKEKEKKEQEEHLHSKPYVFKAIKTKSKVSEKGYA